MANLSQASIPAGFLKSVAQFGVAESDFLLLADLGIDTHEAFALRVHSREALEEFLRDVICPGAAYRDPVRGLLTFNRTPAVPWQNFKMSEDSAALRKFLLLAKELCKGELEHLAAGQDASRVKVKLASAVAMENSAVARGMPRPGTDTQRPSLFSLTRLARSHHGPGAS